jgi:hypothetical protein
MQVYEIDKASVRRWLNAANKYAYGKHKAYNDAKSRALGRQGVEGARRLLVAMGNKRKLKVVQF